jgi:hypothetical protein
MQEHVTLLPPDARPPDSRGFPASLPPDLLEQVRGRVRLLALLLLVGFAFDPVMYLVVWVLATLAGYPMVMANLGVRRTLVGGPVIVRFLTVGPASTGTSHGGAPNDEAGAGCSLTGIQKRKYFQHGCLDHQ